MYPTKNCWPLCSRWDTRSNIRLPHFGKGTILEDVGAFERSASSYKKSFGYTSQRHEDEPVLMYFRARYYDPETGEFISRDPLEYVDGMSLYRGYFVPGGVDPLGVFQEPSQEEIDEHIQNAVDVYWWAAKFGTPLAKKLIRRFAEGRGGTYHLTPGEMKKLMGTQEGIAVMSDIDTDLFGDN